MEVLERQKQRLTSSLSLPLKFILLLWAIHLLQLITGADFGYLGILPWNTVGLKGILFAPLIHADFQHLISNSIPLFVLSAIVMYFYRRVAVPSFMAIYLLTGIAVWLFARGNVFHIGASGVVYGLVSFVFWTGIFRRSIQAIILALVVTFLYSGMFLGVLPNQEGISWESHLMGGVVGILVAYWFKDQLELNEQPKQYSWELDTEPADQKFFFERDVFERTKEERRREQQERQNGLWFSDRTWND